MKSKMRKNSYKSPFAPQTFVNSTKLDEILQRLPNKKCRVLDVGCGYGTLIERLTAKGHDCYGVEPDATAIAVAKGNKLKVKRGMAERIPYPGEYFDVVVSADVIEHLRNPQKAILEIHRVLRKGGVVILTTPNLLSFWLLIERFWDWYAELDYHHEHLVYFSPRSLRTLLERNGFRVERTATLHLISFLLSPFSANLAGSLRQLEHIALSKVLVGFQIIITARKK